MNFLWKMWTCNTALLSPLGKLALWRTQKPLCNSEIQSLHRQLLLYSVMVQILFPPTIRSHLEQITVRHEQQLCTITRFITVKHSGAVHIATILKIEGLSPCLIALSLLKAENWNQGLQPPNQQISVKNFNVKQNFSAVFLARVVKLTELKLIAQIPPQ